MRRPYYLGLTVAAVAIPACGTWALQGCSRTGPCAATSSQPKLLVHMALTALLLFGGATLLAWFLRFVWIAASSARHLQGLSRQDLPVQLKEAVEQVGASAVRCLAANLPMAFCAGVLRPTIFVTSGLVDHLRDDELKAVLVHEDYHCRRRDPLRYALRHAAAEAFFYLPLLSWWDGYQRENAELRADLSALHSTGRRPLAGALWAVAGSSAPDGVAAFQGAAELRAAQVLGDPIPPRQPSIGTWLASAVGVLAMLGLTFCLSQTLFFLS
jgi:beta-lactamase regulating signal transducer with metallopeptidase domain